MRSFRLLSATAGLALVATLGAGGLADAAVAATASPAVTNGDGSNTALGSLLGSLSYRGAEHPYLVGNLADAVKRFGAGSAQASAARAGLDNNVSALAGLLASDHAQKVTFGTALTARDTAELAYAAAIVAGDAPAQLAARAGLVQLAGSIASSVHAAIRAIDAASVKSALLKLNSGDETALKEAALNQPGQFLAVEKGSAALGLVLREIGIALAAQRHYSGLTKTAGVVLPQRGAAYRGLLEAAFTEHVYQTGLLGMAILRNGPRSPAAVAARLAENDNTSLVAILLGDLGTGTAHTRAVWNEHITGYGDYLTGLYTGSATTKAAAAPLLAGYESAITAIVKKAVPAYNTAALRASYTEHVTGTLVVFSLEQANSAALYPMALMGAHHFSDLATDIANKQKEIKG